jgi:hypothetical protein
LLGQDAFGLVGIASLIQGWVMLLNSGLAPVTGREAAKAYSGGGDWKIAASFSAPSIYFSFRFHASLLSFLL